MASALRRYAYGQARIRAKLSRLLTRQQLEVFAAYPDESLLSRELAALGWEDPAAAVLSRFGEVLDMLAGQPRDVVLAYRARYECENLGVLLRALERGVGYAEIAALLHPVGALAPGPRAEELLEARSLADAVSRLDAKPFGEVLRRHVRAAGAQPLERFRLELVAERVVYEDVWAAVQGLEPGDRRFAERVVGVKLDCVNLVRTARLRTHHGLAPEEVLAYAIRGGLHLGAAQRAVLAHEPLEAWPALFASTPYGVALAAAGSPPQLEAELARVLARAAERVLGASPFQLGLMLAYLVLVELQAADLRRLLEGKRLQRPEEWLGAGLVTRRGP